MADGELFDRPAALIRMPQMTQIAQIQKRSRGRPKAGLETEWRDLKNESSHGSPVDSFCQVSPFGQRRFAPPANAAGLCRGRQSRTGI